MIVVFPDHTHLLFLRECHNDLEFFQLVEESVSSPLSRLDVDIKPGMKILMS